MFVAPVVTVTEPPKEIDEARTQIRAPIALLSKSAFPMLKTASDSKSDAPTPVVPSSENEPDRLLPLVDPPIAPPLEVAIVHIVGDGP
jgi:hypothetical protein